MMQSSNRLSSAKGPPPSARPVASSDPSQHPHQHRHRHRQLGTAAVVAGGSRSAAQAGSSRCQQVKCVFVGDGAIGKTSLIVSYTTNGYPAEYVPTAFDTYSVVVTIDNKPCQLQLCDTAGQDDFDSIRPLCYKHTDVFMVCFSVVSPGSFASIRSKWLPEIRRSLQKQAGSDQQAIPPFILVGTQCDLRHDVKVLIELDAAGQQPISSDYARAMAAKFGAMSYIECSALTQKNLKEVFDTAILAALDYRNQVKKKSTPSIITANGGCSSPLASRSPRLANNAPADHSTPAVAKTTVAGGHSKSNGSKLSETSGHRVPGSPPPLPLSPHPTRHHFVPIERTKGAKISDARLVGWRKSLTKLSAQEALESEAAAAAAATADDYESFHYLPPPPPPPPQSAQPVASTSCSTSNSTNSPGSPNNYQTNVRSRRSNCNGNVATGNSGANAALLTSDLDDDQGFHDDEDDEEDEEDEDGEEDTAEVESASFSDDQACLSGGQKSNCHYYYHRGPNSTGNQQPAVLSQQSSQSRAKYGPVGLRSGLKGGGGSGSQATYYYYRAPQPPVPSPPYNDPYRADYHFQQASPALAARLLPLPPQPLPVVASQRPPSKLQSFFNFSRPTSDNHPKVAGNTGGGGSIFSGHQTNLNTTLRSSSFFFLASNAYKKTVDEKPAKAKSKKAVSKSHSTSSSTNTCTTTSSSSSSSSSTSSTMSNSLFKSPSHGGAHHHPHNAGLGSALYRSEIFQIMSNSVTELRNRKSLLKKFTLSSSNSSRSSSRRSSANSVSEKTKLKAKKLKELYYYDEDDYEEIDEGKGRRKCLFSCCFPFRR